MRLRLGKTVPWVLACGAVVWIGCGGSDATSTLLIADSDGGAGDGAVEGASVDGSGGANGDGGGTNLVGDAGGPGGDTTTIPCGANACSIPTQVCCITAGGGGGGANATYTCATSCGKIVVDGGDAAASNGNGDVVALGCTYSANCALGSICCIHQAANGGVVSECTVGASCGKNAAQLCDPNAAVTGCPAGGQNDFCSSQDIGSWGLTPPFATCGGIGN